MSFLIASAIPALAGSGMDETTVVNLTGTVTGIVALVLFIAAYSLVIFEEKLHMRKSKPVLLAAGVIWGLVALAYTTMGDTHTPHEAVKHNMVEYAELFLFFAPGDDLYQRPDAGAGLPGYFLLSPEASGYWYRRPAPRHDRPQPGRTPAPGSHLTTAANVLVGILSAIVDNIPVMFALLTMDPVMSHGQWLLVTLTAGVGDSMLSIGSAAGVALMGSARGIYTFGNHLKWSWAVALAFDLYLVERNSTHSDLEMLLPVLIRVAVLLTLVILCVDVCRTLYRRASDLH